MPELFPLSCFFRTFYANGPIQCFRNTSASLGELFIPLWIAFYRFFSQNGPRNVPKVLIPYPISMTSRDAFLIEIIYLLASVWEYRFRWFVADSSVFQPVWVHRLCVVSSISNRFCIDFAAKELATREAFWGHFADQFPCAACGRYIYIYIYIHMTPAREHKKKNKISQS